MQALNLSPALATVLALAAASLRDAPKSGIARLAAESELGDVLLVVNGAPLGFAGPLNPAGPAYPLGLGADPVLSAARDRVAARVEALGLLSGDSIAPIPQAAPKPGAWTPWRVCGPADAGYYGVIRSKPRPDRASPGFTWDETEWSVTPRGSVRTFKSFATAIRHVDELNAALSHAKSAAAIAQIEAEAYSFHGDTAGGARLVREDDGAEVYLQPGDDRAQGEADLLHPDGSVIRAAADDYFASRGDYGDPLRAIARAEALAK